MSEQLRDSLLAIIDGPLTRDGVSAIQNTVRARFNENPSFCGTLEIACEWILNRWDDQATTPDGFTQIQGFLLTPLRAFIESNGTASDALFHALHNF